MKKALSITKHYLVFAIPAYLIVIFIAFYRQDISSLKGFGVGVLLSIFQIIRTVARIESIIIERDNKKNFFFSWEQLLDWTVTLLTLYWTLRIWDAHGFIACAVALALKKPGYFLWFKRKGGVK